MKKTLLLLVSMLISVAAFAQVTTSGVSGQVVDQSGEPLIGATVYAVHTASGTAYGAATNIDGRYTIQGMRSGGPYSIEVSYIGYQSVEVTDLTLRLGEVFNFSVSLVEGTAIDEVVVLSTSADRFNNSKTGAAKNFSSSDIEATPTVSRSVYDVIAQSPLANSYGSGISFAGSNNRYNSFQIDGAISNDVFGLTSSGTNGGQTSTNIVALDALEEIQVVIAPFDVRQGGFTGGGINAVTKSGTNEFGGSIYAYYTNEDLYGTTAGELADGESREKASEQLTRIIGATAGGAIIKDKLFAFVSVEQTTSEEPVSYNVDGSSGYMSEATAKQISDQYYALTGITQTYGKHTTTARESLDLLARFDYNINQNNKLMFRIQYKDASDDKYGNYSSSYYFDDSGYTMSNKTLSLVAELNSRITNEISNELRVGYTRVRDSRSVNNLGPTAIIYNVDFGVDSAGDSKTGTVYIGTERYSGANALDQDVYTITDNLSFYKGSHTLTVGTHNEFYSIGNTYIANSTGTYGYNSLDAFLSNTPSSYAYSYAVDCDNQDYMPIMNAGQFGFYVQDEWKKSDKLTLTAGLRADLPVIFNDPVTNPDFNSSVFAESGEYEVGRMPKTQILWSPRVGFRYQMDESTLLRGGAGVFTGRVPFVWLHNAYSNSGYDKKSITAYSSLQGLSTTPSTDYAASTETINVVSEDFKYPQVFRANVGLDKNLGDGWNLTFEALYSKNINDVNFVNAALADNGSKTYMVEGVEDSAITHYDIISTQYSPVISLENTSEGYSYSLSGMIQKSFDMGLNLTASYTFGHSYNINNGTSSQAISNWRYNATVNSNSPELGFSTYDIPHQVSVTANYMTPTYGKGFYSVVGLTYNGASGYRYSYMYNDYSNDLNGDNYNSYTLMYIPTDSEIDMMNWASADDKASFQSWVESDDYASSHRGEFAERNAILSPFEHHVNLHFAQNYIYNKSKGSRVELSFDIMNLGNLLNREWGMYSASTYGAYPLKVESVTAGSDGNYTTQFSWNGSQEIGYDEYSSRWYMQLGLRITF